MPGVKSTRMRLSDEYRRAYRVLLTHHGIIYLTGELSNSYIKLLFRKLLTPQLVFLKKAKLSSFIKLFVTSSRVPRIHAISIVIIKLSLQAAKLDAILDAIVGETIEYLSGQIDAGAEAVQLFDSWAGSLAPDEFERLVIAPNARIVAALRARHPDTPVIGFPKGAGEKLPAYARETGVQAVGVDETIDPNWAARELPAGMPVQGNFDPLLLLAGSDRLEPRVRLILEAFADRPHVFNLGHGIDRRTPIEHVDRLIATVRSFKG